MLANSQKQGLACRTLMHAERRWSTAGANSSGVQTFGAAGFAGEALPKPLLGFAAIATVRRPAMLAC